MLFLLFVCVTTATAQRRIVTVDIETGTPLKGVNVQSHHFAAVTDSLGYVTIPDTLHTFLFSHVNYESSLINTYQTADTVFLISKLNNLGEVLVLGKGKKEDDGMSELERRIKKQARIEAELAGANPNGNLFGLLSYLIPKKWKNRKENKRKRHQEILDNAVAIAAASLFVSHKLVSDLKQEERSKMDLWAKAMKYINEVVDEKGLSLALEFIQSNTTIPVVVTDANGQVLDSRNIEDTARVETFAQQMRAAGDTIPIDLGEGDYLLVCYDESTLLKRLTQYPYWQLGIVMIFVVVAIFALLSSKRAEQNKVWVGLSKETAHQLGTPISSLMAWTEMLKESYPKDELIPEMEQDVKRLERIAERFSKIGSKPEPVDESMKRLIV